MATPEQVLRALADRGSPRGADLLIERLERELTGPEPLRRMTPTRRPVGWRRGLAIAAVTSLAILAVVAITAIIAGLVDDTTPVATTPVTTPDTAPGPESLVPADLFDGMVMREGDEVGVYRGGEFTLLLRDECCVANAMGDTAGGVVFQRSDESILWVDGEGSEPVAVVDAAGADRVSLEDVDLIDGEPTIVFLRFQGGGQVTLATVGLISATASDLVVLADDQSITVGRVSYANGVFVVSLDDASGTRLEFRDATGAIVVAPTNPRPEAGDTSVSQAVFGTDGNELILIERAAADAGGGPADFVTYDLETGEELDRDRLAGLGDRVVAYDAGRVMVARPRAVPEEPPIMLGIHLREGATVSSLGGFTFQAEGGL